MVMNDVIRHWVMVAAETDVGTEGISLSKWDLAAYFYTDNGLVASTQMDRLQQEFSVFAGLFNQVGLRANMQ